MAYLILIFSLIQPVYTLVFAIGESIKKKSGPLSIFCVALAFAAIAFCLVPPIDYDLTRHYIRIDSLQNMSLSSAIEVAPPGYVLFNIFAWLINYLSLPKQIFTASIVFVSYYLVLSVFNDIKLKYLQSCSSTYIVIAFLIFWLSIGFIGLTSGIRNPFANIIIFYLGYNLIFYRKVFLFLLGSGFAFFIHPFSSLLAIIVFLSWLLSSWSIKSKILIVVGLILSISSKIVSFLTIEITNILSNFSFYKAVYFSDESLHGAGGYEGALNPIGVVTTIFIPRVPIFLAYFYLLFTKPKMNNTLYILLCIMCMYLGIFYSYRTLYGRMSSFFLFVFGLFLIYENANSLANNKNRNIFLVIYTGSLVLYSVSFMYSSMHYLLSAIPVLFKPLLFLIFDL